MRPVCAHTPGVVCGGAGSPADGLGACLCVWGEAALGGGAGRRLCHASRGFSAGVAASPPHLSPGLRRGLAPVEAHTAPWLLRRVPACVRQAPWSQQCPGCAQASQTCAGKQAQAGRSLGVPLDSGPPAQSPTATQPRPTSPSPPPARVCPRVWARRWRERASPACCWLVAHPLPQSIGSIHTDDAHHRSQNPCPPLSNADRHRLCPGAGPVGPARLGSGHGEHGITQPAACPPSSRLSHSDSDPIPAFTPSLRSLNRCHRLPTPATDSAQALTQTDRLDGPAEQKQHQRQRQRHTVCVMPPRLQSQRSSGQQPPPPPSKRHARVRRPVAARLPRPPVHNGCVSNTLLAHTRAHALTVCVICPTQAPTWHRC